MQKLSKEDKEEARKRVEHLDKEAHKEFLKKINERPPQEVIEGLTGEVKVGNRRASMTEPIFIGEADKWKKDK